MTRRKGFTLVEILVVITIITLLVSLLVVLISSLIDRARYAKTAATIKLLDEGCKVYNLDFGQYPPNDKQDSRSLHHHLGMPRKLATQKSDTGGTLVSTKPPIIEFQRDMLGDARSGTPDPKTNPVPIVDGFDNPVRYRVPGKYNKRSVDIWSPGKDGKDQLDSNLPDYDDVTNWAKEY
ncbi:MAG TPA: prepilin-type N-terminal cleavage/methylation domain-containing protein [Planctomycetota bacterium]|nr:prepilin-type N-terminal cleavage/methylation domain-containing protein [Planctomycetota bacterium]